MAPLGEERILRLGAAAWGVSGGEREGQSEDRADIYPCEPERAPFKSLSFLVFKMLRRVPSACLSWVGHRNEDAPRREQ